MKNRFSTTCLRLQSICRDAICPSLWRAVLLLAAAGAMFASSLATAQVAHFSGAELTVRSGLNDPGGLAVDQAGNIYIAGGVGGNVLKETPSSTGYVESVVVSGLGEAIAVAVDSSGDVYVCDGSHDVVYKMLPFGTIYIQTTVAANLPAPEWVSVDASGNVYVSMNNDGAGTGTVVMYTPSGNGYTSHVIASGLNGPFGTAEDASGDVFIADSDNNRVLVEILSGSTYKQSVVASGLNFPIGVKVDGNGNVYIADSNNDRILKETPFFGYEQSVVPTVSNLVLPSDIALDASGNLYVSEGFNNGVVLEEAYTGANFFQEPIGSASNSTQLNFTFDSPGTLGSTGFKVLTQGAPSMDFAWAGNGTCTPSTYYSAGQSCTLGVVFTPQSAGARAGAAGLVNNAGATFVSGYVYGSGQGPQVGFLPGSAKTIPYSNSGYDAPYGVVVDGSGNVFIADANNNRIVKETRSGGSYSESVIGSGLNAPSGLALDGGGNLYIADTGNNQIVEEMFSNGSYVQSDVITGLNSPEAVAVDQSGNLYVADTFNNQILKETPNGGGYIPSKLPILSLLHPFGVAVDASGNVFVSDTGNDRLLVLAPQPGAAPVETILASDLNTPFQVAVDAIGNAYLADYNAGEVLKESPLGNGSYTESILSTSGVSNPYGVAVDARGNVYIADVGNSKLFVEDYSDAPSMSFASTGVGSTSSDSPKSVAIENLGNAPLDFPVPTMGQNPSIVSNFTLNAGTLYACPVLTTGSAGPAQLAAGGGCILSVSFAPLATGALSGSLILSDNALNVTSSQSIALSGTAVKGSQTINFPAIAGTNYAATTLVLSAAASSGLTVTLASITPGICTVSEATASLLTPGACTIQASQPGNGNYMAAASVSQSFAVVKGNQTITMPHISTQSEGTMLSLTAMASSGLAVSYKSTTTSVCTVSASTASFIATGTCSIDATQAGNSVYNAAPAVGTSFTVLPGQTITFATIAGAKNVGATVALSATSSSGLAVKFASTSAVCSVSGNTASLLAAGPCTIQATQPGSSTFGPAAAVSQSFTVTAQTSQSITFAAITGTNYAASTLALSAAATSGLAVTLTSTTPTVCTVSGTTASLLIGGTCSITAVQAGNATYAAAPSVSRSFTVTKAGQTINFPHIASQTNGTMLNLAATASSGLPVTFKSTTTAVCTVFGNTASFIATGTCSIDVLQAGNATYAAATAVGTSFVVLTGQSISFPAIMGTYSAGSSVVLSATASSGLAVKFTSTTPAVCTVSGSTASLLIGGTCSITASQAGNGTYAAATSVSQSLTVTKESQTITFAKIPTQIVGAMVNPVVSASSGLAITFKVTTPTICSMSGSTATMLAAGTCSIDFLQSGNATYAAAPAVGTSFVVNP